jgi:glycosyltransferase involved in cell wall biosynthesis
MEAAAMGKPTVTTNVRGCREVVVDGVTGLVVEPGDVRSLARAISGLIGDPAMMSGMAEAGMDRARVLFDETRVIRVILREYERLRGEVQRDRTGHA